jgi:hypothetical protein
MDDFLHNLRSGKLKQADRGNRSYNDPQYKGNLRRNAMDRRKRELETFERLNAVKEVLENISATQQRMAVAYETRTKAEIRKARALEVLAKNLYMMTNPGADPNAVEALFAPEPVAEIEPPPHRETVETADTIDEIDNGDEVEDEDENEISFANDDDRPDKLSEKDRNFLFGLILQMRNEGHSWENIARHISDQGYPTSTGRGIWRGITAKNLYEKMAATQ